MRSTSTSSLDAKMPSQSREHAVCAESTMAICHSRAKNLDFPVRIGQSELFLRVGTSLDSCKSRIFAPWTIPLRETISQCCVLYISILWTLPMSRWVQKSIARTRKKNTSLVTFVRRASATMEMSREYKGSGAKLSDGSLYFSLGANVQPDAL